MKRLFFLLCVVFSLCSYAAAASRVSQATRNKVQRELPVFGLAVGDNVLIRTFKKESRLELWMKARDATQYTLFRTYPICYYSGGLGPKLRQGDKVTPEGFYAINKKRLNPHSRFHLSMNIGYPNAYDRQHSRTGALIMIHGACDAIGCFAMSNMQIEEIYYLVEQALFSGQKNVEVHAFPFHLTEENLSSYRNHRWYNFWKELQRGYQLFNANKKPLQVQMKKGHYVFSPTQ